MTPQHEHPHGSVNLLHFEAGLPVTGNRDARHHIGSAEHNVDARTARHLRRGPVSASLVRCDD